MENPVARSHGLVVQEVLDEVLVYDLDTRLACCLNSSAAAVWRLCDGTNSVADIQSRFEPAAGGKVSEDLVKLALHQLASNTLLETDVPAYSIRQTRRQLFKIAGAMVALPVIYTLLAPANNAQSLSNCVCFNPGNCISMQGCPSTQNCNPIGICAPNPPVPRSEPPA